MTERETTAIPFAYTGPLRDDRPKHSVQLCKSDILKADVQVIREGGANNLHSHTGNDGFWLVLRGRAKFYDENDRIVADLGVHEGVLVPRDCPYWLESGSDEPLELLHVSAKDLSVKDRRINHRERSAVTRTVKGME